MLQNQFKKFALATLWLTMMSTCGISNAADPFPSKNLRIIVPVAPGATNDFLARSLAVELGKVLNQTVIVENKPGANQIIGTSELAKSAPDGHTMAMLISSHVINPYISKSLPYDPEKDFTPLAMVGIMPGLLTVHPSLPVKTFAELITYAKANPGVLAYGQPGGNSSGHLTMEYLKKQAGIDVLSIPYKGGGPAIIDLLAGRFQVFVNSPTATMPHVKSGGIWLPECGYLRVVRFVLASKSSSSNRESTQW